MTTAEIDAFNNVFLAKVNSTDQHAVSHIQRLLRGRQRPIPSSQCWGMSRRHRAELGRISSGLTGWSRARIRVGVSKTRLIMPPSVNGDPDAELKNWADRVSMGLGSRIPGNWRTSRGRKKRIKWLMRNFGGY